MSELCVPVTIPYTLTRKNALLPNLRAISQSRSAMSRIVQDFLTRQSASFGDGGPLLAISDYDFPLPVLSPERRDVLLTPQHMIDSWTATNRACRDMGCTRLSVKLLAHGLPRSQRFRLWLNHSYLDAQGKLLAGVDTIFFCRDRGHRLCVEMIEILRHHGKPFAVQPCTRALAIAAR